MSFLSKIFKQPDYLALPAPKCTHEWRIISKTYAPPRTDIANLPAVHLEKAMFGVTAFLWECNFCSATRKEELLGSDENTLLELFEKVDKFGMQYVKEGDKTYAIARWVPPTTLAIEDLPMR